MALRPSIETVRLFWDPVGRRRVLPGIRDPPGAVWDRLVFYPTCPRLDWKPRFRPSFQAMDAQPYFTDAIKSYLFDLYDRLDALEGMEPREYRPFVLVHWYAMFILAKHETVVRQTLLDHAPLRRWLPMFENTMMACRYTFRRFPITETHRPHPFRPNEGRLVIACFHALVRNGPWLAQVSGYLLDTTFVHEMQRTLGLMADTEASHANLYPTSFYQRSDPPPYRRRDLSDPSSDRNGLLTRLPCALTQLDVDGFDSVARALTHQTVSPEERSVFA